MGIQPKHQIAEDTFVTAIDEGLGHTPAINPGGNKSLFLFDIAGDLGVKELRHAAFEGVL